MALFDEQIQRIKDKLSLARNVDKGLTVMGAQNHKYQLHDPVTADEISQLEEQYGIHFPDCYKAFLLQIGNGGVGFEDSAAGPYYGIYPLGRNINELIGDKAAAYLRRDCAIYPGMSAEYWQSLNARIDGNDDLPDEEYYKELGKIWGGVIPIGSQGCTYMHALIINGANSGRVVNICTDGPKPQFTFEVNFLDWYERWLDEIISGQLLQDDVHWFGYAIGGPDAAIIRLFLDTDSIQQKQECLKGILCKHKLDTETIKLVEEQLLNGSNEFKTELLQILTKFDYESAKPYLIELAQTDIGGVCSLIRWYAKNASAEWIPLIRKYIGHVDDEEKFRFCAYLLADAGADFGDLIVPFTERENEEMQVTAFYTLGKLKNKSDFLDAFIKGLSASSNRVIHSTLQALSDVHDTRLLPHYKRIAEQFPEEKDYILSNLNYRLKEYGLNNKTILLKEDFEH
ncbi:SMI1 / KNR4 family (SUKH-1) [Chitinophaga sp. YR627]|uniref:SMI1/KNR4 family protein n=1 Tax=Chitinophaga sp. YR627 TaxID=1881041 RepID=UPI0008E1E5AB|nr:SMI1/KNR4 family protein [Chitinophaga sp. YR627]SFO02303.1 SMI1 / KNR4 family (SUKH-1) [Chitinophaga sp. YR627]